MQHTRWLAMAAEIVLAALVAVGVFVSGGSLPKLLISPGLLSPLLFVLLRLRHGLLPVLLALVITILGLAGLMSPWQALDFLLELGFPTILLAEMLRRVSRPEAMVTSVSALLTLGGIGALVLGSGEWRHPLAAVEQDVADLLPYLRAVFARIGLDGEGMTPSFVSAPELRSILLAAFPGLYFTRNLLAVAAVVLLLQAILRRWSGQFGGLAPAPFRWQLPEPLVWVFIAGGVLYLTAFSWLFAVGLNVLIVLVGMYFLQGLSISAFLFQRFQLPRMLAALSVILLLFHPVIPLLVAGVGLFDVWFAFRQLSLPRPPRQG